MMKTPAGITEAEREKLDAEMRRKCWDWYNKGMLAVCEAMLAGLRGKTEPIPVATLLEFCRIIEDQAKASAA
jgi:hypothetical protein